MPRRVKLTVAYDGTAYAGWQVQPNGTTIQEVMEGTFSRILQEPVRLRAAGRTDAGVHAREQVVDFADAGVRDLGTVVHGGNALLPAAIRILSASVAPETFDARRHATAKEYRYFLYLSPADSPFLSRYAWHIEKPLDLDAVRKGLSQLVGEHRLQLVPRARVQRDIAGPHDLSGGGGEARRTGAVLHRRVRGRLPSPYGTQHRRHGGERREGEAFRGPRR